MGFVADMPIVTAAEVAAITHDPSEPDFANTITALERSGKLLTKVSAVFYDLDESGKARNTHVGAIGVADRPLRLAAVEAVLNARVIDETTIAMAEAAASAAVEPPEDIHASAAYRRALVGTIA